MITKFGRELRKLRLDLGITLFEMAQAIEVSSSLLSSVETGKKPATDVLMNKLFSVYPAVRDRAAEFRRLAEETQKEVTINLKSNQHAGANELAMSFARKFDSFSEAEIDQLLKLFSNK